MVKNNKERFELDLSENRKNMPEPNTDEDIRSKMRRGFNNKYVCFEYPFTWQELPKDEEDEFTDMLLFNKPNNAIVKISTQPCLTNNMEDLKDEFEKDLKSKDCDIQQSVIDVLGGNEVYDIFYLTKEGLEVEQFSILKDNNLYTLELYSRNNRDPVAVKSFVELLQSFVILKPRYKVDGDSYEKIE